MNCPKCQRIMRRVAEVSSGSTLELHATSGFYDGYKCWNCGMWIDIVPVGNPLPTPAVKPAYVKQPYAPTNADLFVWEFRESIQKLAKKDTGTSNIARLLRLARPENKFRRASVAASIERLKSGRLEKMIGSAAQ